MSNHFVPNRGDIIWLDFEPTKGKEIGKYRPAFVLSDKQYQINTGLVICCPISSSVKGTKTELSIEGLDLPSAVVCHIVQTLSWRNRKAKLIKSTNSQQINDVLARLVPLMGLSEEI